MRATHHQRAHDQQQVHPTDAARLDQLGHLDAGLDRSLLAHRGQQRLLPRSDLDATPSSAAAWRKGRAPTSTSEGTEREAEATGALRAHHHDHGASAAAMSRLRSASVADVTDARKSTKPARSSSHHDVSVDRAPWAMPGAPQGHQLDEDVVDRRVAGGR